jgi:hypothetical protein
MVNHSSDGACANFWATRSRALRLRGFWAISASPGFNALRDTNCKVGRVLQVQTGWLGGQVQRWLSCRKVCFTKRSSSE